MRRVREGFVVRIDLSLIPGPPKRVPGDSHKGIPIFDHNRSATITPGCARVSRVDKGTLEAQQKGVSRVGREADCYRLEP